MICLVIICLVRYLWVATSGSLVYLILKTISQGFSRACSQPAHREGNKQ